MVITWRWCGCTIAIVASVLTTAAAQQPLEEIEVLGQTPLGAALPVDLLTANAQRATREQIRAQHATDLADFMRRTLSSVFVNEAQSNPLQPDVQYRGFVGSPLLGLPQGIAVYQDGVRINEPFGDTVSWALIPDAAISTVDLIPGSNPLFGRNALGGAIAVSTRDGLSSPGHEVELYSGSFGRSGIRFELGGAVDDRFGWFVAGSALEEDGWRDFSPTDAVQLFSKASWQLDATRLSVSMSLADTDLIGNGAAPVELLALDRDAVFTRPDQTENELALANLTFDHSISEELTVSGNLYVRNSDVATFNGDDSDFEECDDDPVFICEEEDEIALDQNGLPILASEAVEGATVNRTLTEQTGAGFGIQALWSADLRGRENQFVVGVTMDEADIDFRASTELGMLDATRRALPGGVFVGESFTDLDAETRSAAVYFANTFRLSDRFTLSISGRYEDTDIELRDQLGTALNGDHSFSRFNPAAGLTARLTDGVVFYAGYSESSRTPTPVELTCADEDDPCRLPNAFLADPPLEQVVAETFEAGLRGEWQGGAWNASAFRTTNNDDIIFVSAGALTNEGFFQNIGRTRRKGIELSIDGDITPRLSWFANYTALSATFREFLMLPSPNNPAAVDGEVSVAPGDDLPLVPDQLFKAGLRAALSERVSVAANFVGGSDFYRRGDEGNEGEMIGDYFVVNVQGELAVAEDIMVFLKVDNLFDQEYETFGLFGESDEVLGDDFDDARFLSPAAPRAAWIGIRARF